MPTPAESEQGRAEPEAKHWGNTDFGVGLGIGLLFLGMGGGTALIVWAIKYLPG